MLGKIYPIYTMLRLVRLPILNRFMYLESHLASGLEALAHRTVVPILDYAVEGKTDSDGQSQFKQKLEALVRTHSEKNEFFALKPSSLG